MDAPTIPPRAEWIPPASEEYQAKHPNWDEPIPTLANVLDAHKWAALKIPVETKFLGEFITPATKTFLIGTTGIGKTMFGYELVGAMASATDLLHWKCERASRWLVIDGEMPTSLIKKRIAEVLARYKIPDGNLLIYSTGRAEELAKLITDLGEMPPLSTEAGHKWVLKVAEELLVEGILFDNLMSLSPGDHREPQVWLDTLPLADALSRKNIAQIWCDHTGWDTSRQYGTNTKAWRFDTAAVMKPLPEDQRETHELAFTLSFDPPGKCRRRTPDNWADFKPVTLRLRHDGWAAEDAADAKALSAKAQAWLKDISAIFQIPGVAEQRTVTPGGVSCVRFSVSRAQLRDWLRKCGRIGDEPNAILTAKDRVKLREWLNTLRSAGKIGIDGDFIWLA